MVANSVNPQLEGSCNKPLLSNDAVSNQTLSSLLTLSSSTKHALILYSLHDHNNNIIKSRNYPTAVVFFTVSKQAPGPKFSNIDHFFKNIGSTRTNIFRINWSRTNFSGDQNFCDRPLVIYFMYIHYSNRKLLRRLASYKVCLCSLLCVRINTVRYGC